MTTQPWLDARPYRPTAHTRAIRDQIEAILANAGRPMTTAEMVLEMPPYCNGLHACEDGHQLRGAHWRRFEHINGMCLLFLDFPAQDLGRHLRAMARKGRVRRTGDTTTAHWELMADQTTCVADLEAMFAL